MRGAAIAKFTNDVELGNLRRRIAALVAEYARLSYAPRPFEPGVTPVPVSGKVIGGRELYSLVDASLDGWLTAGRFNEEFERRLAAFLGVKYALTTNSGSSANLLAISALTSPQLGERAIKAGDEIITVAAGFPTTVNPMLLYGMVPVFVDIHIPTYNIDTDRIEAALSEKTRAIVLAHTLGNPYNLKIITEIARKHRLWVVEDCCDALGSTYTMPPALATKSAARSFRADEMRPSRPVGTFGDIGTLSFYPAHHITMGEGGAVFTDNPVLKRIMESYRDWGRDCHCAPGADNTCGRRFERESGSLPYGFDHKYIYSHAGYNLKISDMQAACALAQMDRLPGFIEARKRNFGFLKKRLKTYEEFLILPEATPGADPSWFGFPITLRDSSGIVRIELLKYLDQHKIGTRLLFAGNLTRQPYFDEQNYRVSGELKQTDKVMSDTFWVGVFPGLTEAMLDFVAEKIEAFFGVFADDLRARKKIKNRQ